VTVKRYPLN